MTSLTDTQLEREADVQRSVMRLYQAFGCQVIRFAEGRRTKVTPGWPDLALFHVGKRAMWLHEVKRGGGKQSVGQSAMQGLAESCGVRYVLGGVGAAKAQLHALGLVVEP